MSDKESFVWPQFSLNLNTWYVYPTAESKMLSIYLFSYEDFSSSKTTQNLDPSNTTDIDFSDVLVKPHLNTRLIYRFGRHFGRQKLPFYKQLNSVHVF